MPTEGTKCVGPTMVRQNDIGCVVWIRVRSNERQPVERRYYQWSSLKWREETFSCFWKSFKGVQLPYEIRGEPGHERATNSGHAVFDNSLSLLRFNQGTVSLVWVPIIAVQFPGSWWCIFRHFFTVGNDIRSTSVLAILGFSWRLREVYCRRTKSI